MTILALCVIVLLAQFHLGNTGSCTFKPTLTKVFDNSLKLYANTDTSKGFTCEMSINVPPGTTQNAHACGAEHQISCQFANNVAFLGCNECSAHNLEGSMDLNLAGGDAAPPAATPYSKGCILQGQVKHDKLILIYRAKDAAVCTANIQVPPKLSGRVYPDGNVMCTYEPLTGIGFIHSGLNGGSPEVTCRMEFDLLPGSSEMGTIRGCDVVSTHSQQRT